MSSSHTIGGLVLGLALGAGGLWAAQTYLLDTPSDPCGGACGPGTTCDEDSGTCSVAPDPEPEPEEASDAAETKPRRGRRGRRRGGAAANGDGPEIASGPPLDDDSEVPRFDANADQSIGMADGSGRLSDSQVNRELAKLDPTFQACVADAAARVAELGSGTVRYTFGIDGKGKVVGVNASAPTNLRDAGLVPCVRAAVHGHRFPTFDGPTMTVKSSFRVD